MGFVKKDDLIGLDIGSRTIKAAQIVETKWGSTLKNLGSIEIGRASCRERV